MTYRAAILLVALAVAWGAVASGGQPPRPSIVPTKPELEFTYETPQQIVLTPPGGKGPQTYWYVLYQIQNRTGADQIFAPDFVLYTDTGEVVRSGKGVPTTVFAAIQKRHNNPLLQNATGMTGRILQGADNAKDGVAIWRDFDPAARAFDVFVGGLSDERAVVKLPSPVMVEQRDAQGEVRSVARDEVTLAKTLKLSYSLPGEASARAAIKPKLIKKTWVMR